MNPDDYAELDEVDAQRVAEREEIEEQLSVMKGRFLEAIHQLVDDWQPEDER